VGGLKAVMQPMFSHTRRFLLGIGLSVAVAVLSIGEAEAREGAVVHVAPAEVRVGEGGSAAVEIRVDGVADLYALDIRLGFDPAIAQVVDADPATPGVQVRPGDLLSLDFVVRNTADNDKGTVWFAMTQVNPSQPVSGGGTAFIVTLAAEGAVGTGSGIVITEVQLVTSAGDVIATVTRDGQLSVVAPEQAPPTPTKPPPPPQPTLVTPTPTQSAWGTVTETPSSVPTATVTSAPAGIVSPTQPVSTATPVGTQEPSPTPFPATAAAVAGAYVRGASTIEPERALVPKSAGSESGSSLSRLPTLLLGAGGIVVIGVLLMVGVLIWVIRRA
jgi:hypothetical protein